MFFISQNIYNIELFAYFDQKIITNQKKVFLLYRLVILVLFNILSFNFNI